MTPDRIKLPLQFDPRRLKEDLRRLEESDWTDHFVPQNYEGVWSVLPLRAPAAAQHPIMMIYSDPACTEFAATPFLEVCPYIRDVLAEIACPLQSVRLMKLTPGSIIKEHRDLDLDLESGRIRLHIPILTNPDVDFRLNGERVELKEGECWYLRLSDPHSVTNRGTVDRVHLVIDCEISSWFSDLVAQSVSPAVDSTS